MSTGSHTVQQIVFNPELNKLRTQLIDLGAWPSAGDKYLALMTHAMWDRVSVAKKDFEWIPIVIDDVKKGVDIGLQYPAFFQKLLANHELRAAFINRLRQNN